MQKIGEVENNEVHYNVFKDELHCKDHIVNATDVINAYKGNIDRVRLTPELIYRKDNVGDISIGCLQFDRELIANMYKEIINIKIKQKRKNKNND